MHTEISCGILGNVKCTGGIEMNVVEKKRPDSCRIRPKSGQAAAVGADPKGAALPSAAEHQIAEVERTFTDRWEW
jgi:hypothetical protein